MSPNFSIITDSLELKLLSDHDAEQLQILIQSSPTLHRWIDWCHADFSLQEAQQFIALTRSNWAKTIGFGFGIYCRASGTLYGMVAINELYQTFNMVSIGYWIADRYQRRGLGRISIQALVNFCFEMLKVTRVEIVCDPDNHASRRVIESCGAQFETVAANRFIYAKQPKDGAVYAIVP
ncbi:GNAT family N-acetyltransferase [Vibrio sp. WXL210]|uniref:GNAT family N-acetyltransferase n=1 Tax=Vibrio sp. WXL210 TaxID=3450709 RepID=UPI003EC65E92